MSKRSRRPASNVDYSQSLLDIANTNTTVYDVDDDMPYNGYEDKPLKVPKVRFYFIYDHLHLKEIFIANFLYRL